MQPSSARAHVWSPPATASLLASFVLLATTSFPADPVAGARASGIGVPTPRAVVAAPSAPTVVTQTHSADAIAVFERGGDIYYSFYGHAPRVPKPLTTTLSWSWWSTDAMSATDTIVKARPLTPDLAPEHRPDVAFSREGFALAAWGKALPQPQFNCVDGIGNPNSFPRFRGDLKSAKLNPQNNDDVAWAALPDIVATNTNLEDHWYHNPSVSVDSNGAALLVWIHTVFTYSNPCAISLKMRVLSRRWDGSAWVDERVIAGFEPTVAAPPGYPVGGKFHYTDLAMTAKLATDASPKTRQQAIAVWYDFIGSTFDCLALIETWWPKYSVWNGDTWTAAAEVPGRPTAPPYKMYIGEKLGISADQFGDAQLAFPNMHDPDACTGVGETPEVRTSKWTSATQSFASASVLDSGGSPDVAVNQANETIAVYAGPAYTEKWATASVTGAWTLNGDLTSPPPGTTPALASLAPAGGEYERMLVVQTNGTWSQRLGSFAWSTPASLDGGPIAFPELAARTGSPSLPHAEWSYLDYFAADNNLHAAIASGDRAEQIGVGATALFNLVSVIDPLSAWPGAWGAAPPPAPPLPFANGSVRYEVFPGSGPAGGVTQLKDIGEVNTGAPAALSDFLSWALVFYPARRYVVDIGDHGNGWRNTCQDVTNGNNKLDMGELRSAFANVAEGSVQKWDVIAFSACLMGQLEVAYQLYDLGETMVGSEEIMPGAGHSYGDLLPRLIGSPFVSTTIVARTMVTSYAGVYTGGGSLSAQVDTLSAIDLSKVPLLMLDANQFATSINDWLNDNTITAITKTQRVNLVKAQRNASDRFPHPSKASSFRSYYDLGDFATRMIAALTPDDASTSLDDDVRYWAAGVNTRLAAAVLQYFTDVGRPNARGLSAYLETSSAVYSTTKTAYANTIFGATFPQWRSLISNTVGTLDTLVMLDVGTPAAWLQVNTPSSGSIGFYDASDSRCGGMCGVSVDGGRCYEDESDTTLLVPGAIRRFTWRIDGTYTTSSAPYTLTIRTLKDGVIIKQFDQAGTLGVGQVLEGLYIVPYNFFLPSTWRSALASW